MMLVQGLSQGRRQLGRQSAESLTGEEGPFPQWRPHLDGDLAEGLSSLPSSHVSCVLMTQQLVPASKSDPGENKAEAPLTFVFEPQKSENLSITQVGPIQGGGGPHTGMNTRKWGSRGPALEASSTRNVLHITTCLQVPPRCPVLNSRVCTQ